ncbi:MAG: hypothetical protein NUW01_05985 [Gemmatimonadaceae bacterium]|nr:hypothetical protein [Gemmatimonadaceae bacterium]
MPWTLAEHAQAQRDPLRKGVYLGIVRESVIADILNFESTGTLQKTGVRYDSVISPEYIPISGTIPEKTARGKQISWGVYEQAVHIDVPIPLEKEDGLLEKPSARLAKLATIGSAYVFQNQFVNGDQGSDPNGFDGINKIIGNLASAQAVGATELDIRAAASPTSATMQSLIDRLDEAIDAVDGHNPDFALCNRQFGLRIRSIFRREGLLGDNHNWVTQGFPFGDMRAKLSTAATRPMFVYNDIPFYDAGVQADQATQVILNTYTEGGSTSTGTRVFFVKLGEDNLQGLQYSPPRMRSIGVLENKEVERSRFIWDHGIAVWGHRSISKVQGVRVA